MHRPASHRLAVAAAVCSLAACGGGGSTDVQSAATTSPAPVDNRATKALSDAISAIARAGTAGYTAQARYYVPGSMATNDNAFGSFDLKAGSWKDIRNYGQAVGQRTNLVDRDIGKQLYVLPGGTLQNMTGTWIRLAQGGVVVDPAAGNATPAPVESFPAGSFGTGSVPPALVAIGETQATKLSTDATGATVIAGTLSARWATTAVEPVGHLVQLHLGPDQQVDGEIPVAITLNSDGTVNLARFDFSRGEYRATSGSLSEADTKALKYIDYTVLFVSYGQPVTTLPPPAEVKNCPSRTVDECIGTTGTAAPTG